nr:sulfite exporter TauE/SafE family protein [Brachybacterium sp. Marseille-Q7125]
MLSALPDLDLLAWVVLVLGALTVGFSKTALPGAGTIAVGLFALALPAKESTAALLLLLIVGDMTALWVYRREPDVRTLIRLLPSAMVGVLIGVWFFAISDGPTVRITIGLILLALVVVTVWRRHVTTRREARAAQQAADGTAPSATASTGSQPGAAATAQGIGFGLLGGFTTMVANAAGPVMSMYFYAMRMPVLTFLGTSAWYFAIINLFKVPFSAGLGLMTREVLTLDLLLVPIVLVGAYLGSKVARRIPQALFENLVLALTVISALALLVL